MIKRGTAYKANKNGVALNKIKMAQDLRKRGYKIDEIAHKIKVSTRSVSNYLQVDLLDLWEREENPFLKVEAADLSIGILEFVESEKYLGVKLFPMQRLILKCFYGLVLTDEEKAVMKRLKKEDKTTWREGEHYVELVLNVGMKGTKTTIAGIIALIEEFELYRKGDFEKHYGFPPGKEAYIINVATNADQAKSTIFAQIKGLIRNSPFFRTRRYEERDDEYEFRDHNVFLKSLHSNSASIVGLACKAVLLDELSRFKDKGGKYSADVVYDSLTHSIQPFGEDGKIIDISSPLFEGDKICSLYEQSKEINGMLGFHLPTWEINLNLPFESETMQRELKKNPESFWRDFGARPSRSVESYCRLPNKIDELFSRGRLMSMENPMNIKGQLKDSFAGKPGMEYYLHGDPAARNDAYGLCLGHIEKNIKILDLVYAFDAPQGGEINLEEVSNFILELYRRFIIKKFTFDTWQAAEIMQKLERRGALVEELKISKQVYDVGKEEIYAGNVASYPNLRAANEWKDLELISGQKVDHRKGKSKDIADSMAGVIFHLAVNPIVIPVMVSKDPGDDWYQAKIGGICGEIRESLTERR